MSVRKNLSPVSFIPFTFLLVMFVFGLLLFYIFSQFLNLFLCMDMGINDYAKEKFIVPWRPYARYGLDLYEQGIMRQDNQSKHKLKYYYAQEKIRQTLLDVIVNGTELALNACQREFKWEKWNCPEKHFHKRGTHKITKELAFISSIIGAGVFYSMTKKCAEGDLEICKCPNVPNGSWKECMTDLEKSLKNFILSLENSVDAASLIDVHNQNLGHLVVKNTFKEQCKCHGLTGSCTVKTCWEQLPSFAHIAAILKKKYHRAQRVRPKNSFINPDEFREYKTSMIFLVDSPDYCKPLAVPEWPGTEGRECSKAPFTENSDHSERRSCRELCRSCGHQVKKRSIKKVDKCNCNFVYCCEVQCEKCSKEEKVFTCDSNPKVLRGRRSTPTTLNV